MPKVLPLRAPTGPGSTRPAWGGRNAPALSAAQAEILRVTEARNKVATLLASGELWALPIFTRLEAELDRLNAQQDSLTRARQIAADAARVQRVA